MNVAWVAQTFLSAISQAFQPADVGGFATSRRLPRAAGRNDGAAWPLRVAWLAIVLVWLPAGCAVGQNYSRPSASVPSAYAGETNAWKVAEPRANLPRGNWW